MIAEMRYRLVPSSRTPTAADDRPRRRRRAARATVAVLPSLLTLGNLLCGFIAIFLASRPATISLPWNWTPLTFAAAFIFIGMICDGLDGSVARLTRSTSDLGEQLDSMADMVTFGVAPAFIAVQLVGIGTPWLTEGGERLLDRITLVIAGIYVACAGLRLARYNVEIDRPQERDHLSFKGLPSPGAGGTVASMVLLHQHFVAQRQPEHWLTFASALVMVGVMLLAALAMVGRLRYVHIVNRYIRGRARFGKFAWVVMALLLLTIAPQASAAAVFVVYSLSAPVWWLLSRGGKRQGLTSLTSEPQVRIAGGEGRGSTPSGAGSPPQAQDDQSQERAG